MKDLPDTISKILQTLAAQFGTTAAHLWQVLVAYQISDSKVYIAVGVVFEIGWLISALGFALTINDMDEDLPTMFFVGMTVSGIIATMLFAGGYLGLHNPEYYALTTVLSYIPKP